MAQVKVSYFSFTHCFPPFVTKQLNTNVNNNIDNISNMPTNKAVKRKATIRKRMGVQRTAMVAGQVEAERVAYRQRQAIRRVPLQQRMVAVQRENRSADQVEADRTANRQRVAVQREARSADPFKKASPVKKKLEGVPVEKAAIVNMKTKEMPWTVKKVDGKWISQTHGYLGNNVMSFEVESPDFCYEVGCPYCGHPKDVN